MENRYIKILAIDDNQDNLIILKALIKEAFSEATVFTALKGQKGIELAAQEDPDVILLGIVMPGMDGFEVCRKMKADNTLRETPVVFVTAIKGDKESRIRALECGAEAFLARPIDASELIAQIRAMVKIKKANVEKCDENKRLTLLVEERTKNYLKENEARKESERALLEAQKLAHIGSFEFDVVNHRLTCTDEGLNICGINREEYSGIPDEIIQCIHPEDREYALEINEKAIRENKAMECEYRIVKTDGNARIVRVRIAPEFDKNDTLIRCRGTVQDITERKQTEDALKESEDKFRYIFDNSSVGKVLTLPTGELQVNKMMCEMLGYSAEEVEGKTWREISHPDDIEFSRQEVNALLSGEKEVVRSDKRYIKKDGSVIWADVLSSIRRDTEGKHLYSLTEIIDITDQKNAHEALLESERSKTMLLSNLPGMAYRCNNDREWTMNFLSDGCYELTGYKPENLINNNELSFNDVIAPEYREAVRCEWERILPMRIHFRLEYEINTALGVRKWVYEVGQGIYDENGKVEALEGIIIDITDKKQAEQAQYASEEKYRRLFETMAQGVVHQAADGAIISANPAAERILGLTFDQMQGKTSMDPSWKAIREDGSPLPGSEQPAMIALHTGKSIGPTILGVFKPQINDHIWLSVNAIPLFRVGEKTPHQVYVTIQDITAERKAKQNYKLLFQEMFEACALHEIICDEHGKPVDYRFLAVNSAFERMTGLKAKDILNKNVLEVLPETEAYWIENYGRVALTGEPIRFENYSQTMDKYFAVSAYRPAPNEFACTFTDITGRKQMEQELRESQAILQAAFENSPAGIAIANAPDGKIRYVNNAGLFIKDKLDLELVKNVDIHKYADSWDILHLDGTPYKEEEMPLTRAILYGEICSEEFIIRRDNHEDRNVLAKAAPIKDSDNNISAGIIVFLDITERKRMYDSLSEALKFNQDIINSTNEGIIVYDNELRYKVWNPFMENITGLSSQVVLERKATDVFPWLEEIGAIDNLKKVLKGEVLIERDFPYNIVETNCSGWVRTNNGPLYNSKGKIIGVLGTVQNITERKKAEDNLIYYSYHDQLTGLYNRRFFEEELSRLDTKRNLPITIVMGDLNGLKMINDSLGHAVGDALVRKAAEVIKKVCRADDIIARVGGDEFNILLPKTSASEAACIIGRIKEMASKEKTGSVVLSISFGHETKLNSADSILEVRANAENDMYRHKLYERGSMRSKVIDMIMNTLYEKSDREMFHSKRVSEMCEAIAVNLQFDEDEVNQIRMAGLLHDIGKIGVDEKVLNKDKQLDDDEWEQIKKHPEGGWRILNAVSEFSELANFVLEHHERWDGTGYPNGLKGKEISIQARIIAVADAYDAMTSERTYGKALSEEKAIKEIKNNAESQFDPDIAKVFIEKVICI